MPKRSLFARVERWFASPKVAISLFVIVTTLIIIATSVPQTGVAQMDVASWAKAHPFAERIVQLVGFHAAYVSPLFLTPTVLLIISTAVCSWRRTSVARDRWQLMHAPSFDEFARRAGAPRATFAASDAEGPISRARTALESEGLRVRRLDDGVLGSSRGLGLLGSPVFHWSLVALFVVVVLGQLSNAAGLIGVPVGSVLADTPASYGLVHSGPLYRWSDSLPRIAVTDLKLYNVIGGLDRGPTPHVVLRDANGATLAEGDVYPNSPLRWRTMIVHPGTHGFALSLSMLSPTGTVVATASVLLDLPTAAGDHYARGDIAMTDSAGKPSVDLVAQAPLDPAKGGGYFLGLPRRPKVDVALRTLSGGQLAESTLRAGESMQLPGGGSVRVDGIGYYARLSVVDDWSVGVIYFLFALATIAVAFALLSPETVAVVAATESGEIALWVRDWRGRPSRASEIERAVADALRAGHSEVSGD